MDTRRKLIISLRFRRWAVRIAIAALPFVAAWLVLRLVPLPARLASEHSTVIRHSDGSVAHVFLSPDDRVRIAARLDAVDPDYVAALIRFEDRRFRQHLGVDPLALVRAAALDVRRGRIVSGGSTLTMQLVRVLEPRPRTLASKAIEMLRALQLEARLSKDEVLAAYMTFAPYGANIEGVEAASHAYFGHGAGALTAPEIATLLAVPQRPAQRHPSPDNAERLEQARDRIARLLASRGALELTDDELANTRVPERLRAIPREMAHAATWLKARHPRVTDITSSIDRHVQSVAETQLARARADLEAAGIHDGAVVVVEHATGDVRALVGNFDFWASRPGSQMVAFDAPRSPGSTLKPFVFALAIDAGLALPSQLVPDVPVTYSDYAPENYEGTFAGLVRLGGALSWSLNVPFVNLVSQLGVERFVGTLREAGMTSLSSDPGHYGLAVAIGGIEVTPLELAGLYSALADDGQLRPLRLLAEPPEEKTRSLISPGAAYLTRQVLARRDRPDFPMRRQFSGAPSRIHWKTGTSQRHLDAWAAGSGSRYTSVVWLGNLDRTPSAALIGSEAPAPILFDVLEALADTARLTGREAPPPDLRAITTCAYSGFLPGEACGERVTALALTRQVPTQSCPYHVALDIDDVTGLALNPTCRVGRSYRRESFLTWPSTMQRWLSEQHRSMPTPPELAPGCQPAELRRPPTIVSPPDRQVVVLVPGVDAEEQQVPLLAESSATSARHSWFVDGEYLGTSSAHQHAWWTPRTGRHDVVVTDEAGLSARRLLEVRAAN